MSDIQNAVDSIRKFARLFESLTTVADQLEAVGALDNAKKEHAAALKSLGAEKYALQQSIDELLGKHKAAVEKTIEDVQVVHDEAANTLSAAKVKATEIVAAAHKKADAIHDKELVAAQQALADTKVQLAILKDELAILAEDANAAIETKKNAEATLAEINKMIAQAKAKVAGLLE